MLKVLVLGESLTRRPPEQPAARPSLKSGIQHIGSSDNSRMKTHSVRRNDHHADDLKYRATTMH
jgi:hypothetical protein